jgi:glycosyltransferase involved in cell wall biosynthesis
VYAQTYQAWELFLVDDGSTDESVRLARAVSESNPQKVRYLQHEGHGNLGQAASRNAAIRQARGDYLAFLDADDVWLPSKLERQVALLESLPRAAMVFGASEYWHSWTGVAGDSTRDHVPHAGIQTDTLFEPPTLLTVLYPLGEGTPPPPSDLLVRKTTAEAIGGFEQSLPGVFEDQAFLAKMYLNHPIYVSGELWDRYRIHEDSCVASSHKSGEYQSDRRQFLTWLESYLRQQGYRNPQSGAPFGVHCKLTGIRTPRCTIGVGLSGG